MKTFLKFVASVGAVLLFGGLGLSTTLTAKKAWERYIHPDLAVFPASNPSEAMIFAGFSMFLWGTLFIFLYLMWKKSTEDGK